ncbi:Aldose 1-epimerase [Caldithrix abyssi DSM 13497]|uniref:Aldose 1-epimerase n=1 Tax=Caldithrix abyssi DSM 13497 TaxID=880073 RepID=H1XQS8_CALAY|nr:aldose epimerase family protein [Caldithrix abyssi]APF18338.1 aldose 1-epimerase [Caldithrix abyssi DSM 13497]EHO42351.1 Aldose 1-epimerase [Caldithrix abyssi DSM 13497]
MELISAKSFRKKLQGVDVDLITLKNDGGMQMQVTNYGARVVSLLAPDEHGNLSDVVAGYDDLDAYVQDPYYFGAIIGRCANRIADGKFSLFGKSYQLTLNVGKDHVYGGIFGLHAKVWIMEQLSEREVLLSVGSPNGEEGYPGSVHFEARYLLREDNSVYISLTARSDQPTIVNMTHHSYFNLSGFTSSSDTSQNILDHRLKVEADYFTPINERLLPTGEIRPVAGSALDFRDFYAIGQRIDEKEEQIQFAGGYDHNFVLRDFNNRIIKAATVIEPTSGRKLEVFTNVPGLQLYTANKVLETSGKHGVRFGRYSAFCLETQHFPDAPNHPHFPMIVLMPEHIYRHEIIYRFSLLQDK